jgi:hypothetical protein
MHVIGYWANKAQIQRAVALSLKVSNKPKPGLIQFNLFSMKVVENSSIYLVL